MQESRRITRKSASNLALAFVLLPKPRREAMAALYAFCREVDDIADDESIPVEKRRVMLASWREDIARACSGTKPEFAVNQELQPVVQRYRLPLGLFHELLRGVEMDLEIKRYSTPEELELYCYRVASVVGLLSIEIFGYQDPKCREYAIFLGKALQLTNILRDIGTDAARGRVYLPLSELKRFGVTEQDILQGRNTASFQNLAAATAAKARTFYSLARNTLPASERRSMVAAELMASVYWRLLRKLERTHFPVLGATPTRLGKAQKVALVLHAWVRLAAGGAQPSYGT